MTQQSNISPTEILQWYSHAGVDIALRDEPIDQFAAFADEAKTRKTKLLKPKLAAPAIKPNTMSNAEIPDEGAIENARQLAKSAKSLEELRELLANFKGCNLRLGAKQMVFGDGDTKAQLMLVGEAPGRDEDLQGMPFVGRSGQLLERMLAAIGLAREEVYISNVIPWRPPGNRAPTPAETQICRPFIERHIELVSPKIMVLLGGAAKTLLNSNDDIRKLRGKWKTYKSTAGEIDTLPTLHPDFLLSQPVLKRLAWQDLLQIKSKLDAARGDSNA